MTSLGYSSNEAIADKLTVILGGCPLFQIDKPNLLKVEYNDYKVTNYVSQICIVGTELDKILKVLISVLPSVGV